MNELTEKIIGAAYRVANELGTGFMEKVYENALSYELKKTGLEVRQQYPVSVYYDSHIVGDYIADILVADAVIVELKTVKSLDAVHMAQCLNYLKATNLMVCLLINFGRERLEIKRIVNNFKEYV